MRRLRPAGRQPSVRVAGPHDELEVHPWGDDPGPGRGVCEDVRLIQAEVKREPVDSWAHIGAPRYAKSRMDAGRRDRGGRGGGGRGGESDGDGDGEAVLGTLVCRL